MVEYRATPVSHRVFALGIPHLLALRHILKHLVSLEAIKNPPEESPGQVAAWYIFAFSGLWSSSSLEGVEAWWGKEETPSFGSGIDPEGYSEEGGPLATEEEQPGGTEKTPYQTGGFVGPLRKKKEFQGWISASLPVYWGEENAKQNKNPYTEFAKFQGRISASLAVYWGRGRREEKGEEKGLKIGSPIAKDALEESRVSKEDSQNRIQSLQESGKDKWAKEEEEEVVPLNATQLKKRIFEALEDSMMSKEDGQRRVQPLKQSSKRKWAKERRWWW
ncbi:hypothetical protein B0H16DRAFT_1682281 [Mycena metata]|uniref:Uncharacterized protein n=1 Tax=Mycena metata TaxID=1033252 RepID=A0AAD7KE79_9AGAR|nr:hypothetical protein B0H16DRAFT_1682281 [Mycena metata]